MPRPPVRPSAQSVFRFDMAASVFVDLRHEGDDLIADGIDPQIYMEPTQPLAAGWWQVLMEAEGALSAPRLYLDFGDGFSEQWAYTLEVSSTQPDARRAIVFLPVPARAVRLDPTDRPGRFSLHGFRMDPLEPRQLLQALARPTLGEPAPAPAGWRSSLAARRHGRADARVLERHETNCCVVFAERSHLSGISLAIDAAHAEVDELALEIYRVDAWGLEPMRSIPVRVRLGSEWEHVYFDPVEDSLRRFFVVKIAAKCGRGLVRPRTLRAARPTFANPEPHSRLPQSIVFSPVTQCNLNCVHCVTAPTRKKFATASDAIFEQVAEATRDKEFSHLGTDFSGDILFNEKRHGGWLSRMISLDVPFRIDTNANYLDEDISRKLVGSRLMEINFSLDSMDPAKYAWVRRGSIPLDEVLEKIAAFMRIKREAGHTARVLISFLLMRSTAATIKPAFAFAREHGIDFVSVIPMTAFTTDMVEELLVWDTKAVTEVHHELSAESRRTGVPLHMQPPITHWRDDGHAPCDLPWGSAVVLGNGDVHTCYVPGTRIGNLHEQTLHELWHGPAYREFRRRVNSPNPPESCRNCCQSRIPNNRRSYAPVLERNTAPVKLVRL